MTNTTKSPISLDVDPIAATSALGLAQLCMLRYFEEMNLLPVEKRALDARTQKKLLHIVSSIYHDCIDAVGLRGMAKKESLPSGIGAVASGFSCYMGVGYDSIEQAV